MMFEEEMRILQAHMDAVKTATEEVFAKLAEGVETIGKFKHIDKELAVAMLLKCLHDEINSLGSMLPEGD